MDDFLNLSGKKAWDYGKEKLDSGEWKLKDFTEAMTEWCKLNRRSTDIRMLQESFDLET